jgi:nucleotide sugar dehydrogenase
MRIAIIGAGHVGLVGAACFANMGTPVRVHDIDHDRIAALRAGYVPLVEPHLDELLHAATERGLITFDTDAAQAVGDADVIFLCVNTSSGVDGEVDLSSVVDAARNVTAYARDGAVMVNRSTAPVGTARYLRAMVAERRPGTLGVAVNPEFLAEGTAVRDFLLPDRIVIGAWDVGVVDRLVELYEPILQGAGGAALGENGGRHDAVPLVVSTPSTAELAKYAANAFLAIKISFINEIASIAEELGADIEEVARVVGLDRRIGPHFLRAGVGWGGYCFPKDIVALQGMAETHGVAARMLRAANEVNEEQRMWVLKRLQRHLRTLFGQRIVLLGLSFKPHTDDLRNAPALEIASRLIRAGAEIIAYDPAVRSLPDDVSEHVQIASDAMTAVRNADAVVLVTDWPEFTQLDLGAVAASMRGNLLLDGRNQLDPATARRAGLVYVGVGREQLEPLFGLDEVGSGTAEVPLLA